MSNTVLKTVADNVFFVLLRTSLHALVRNFVGLKRNHDTAEIQYHTNR